MNNNMRKEKEIVMTTEALRYMQTFERYTGSKVKDCFEYEGKVIFIVDPQQVMLAVGKNGEKIIDMEKMLNKKIQVVEFNPNIEQFVRNLFYLYKPTKIEFSDKNNIKHVTVTVDPQLKARAIGKEGKNLKIAREILVRHTELNSINIA